MKVDNGVAAAQNSLDWGTVAVFTCAKSCEEGNTKGWTEEFAWLQAMH